MPYVPCPDCKSSRAGRGWEYCDRCQGWGDVDRHAKPKMCPKCRGEGKLACRRCRGSGTTEE